MDEAAIECQLDASPAVMNSIAWNDFQEEEEEEEEGNLRLSALILANTGPHPICADPRIVAQDLY